LISLAGSNPPRYGFACINFNSSSDGGSGSDWTNWGLSQKLLLDDTPVERAKQLPLLMERAASVILNNAHLEERHIYLESVLQDRTKNTMTIKFYTIENDIFNIVVSKI